MSDLENFKDTRLNIVDEISFAAYLMDLCKLSRMLQNFTQSKDRPFGNIPIVFLGDFHQLEPVGDDAIYNRDNALLWEQALTHMVELQGRHRFKDCPEMQSLMDLFRNPSDAVNNAKIRKILCSRVVNNSNNQLPKNSSELAFATFHNANRAEINSRFFRHHLEKHHPKDEEEDIPNSAVVIRASAKWKRFNRSLNFRERKVLFEQCSEAHVKHSSNGNNRRADPLLCLYADCPLMVNKNLEVRNGVANGTTCKFEKVVLKTGKSTTL